MKKILLSLFVVVLHSKINFLQKMIHTADFWDYSFWWTNWAARYMYRAAFL